MKAKLVKSNGCVSVVVDEESYFAYGTNNKLKGKISIISDKSKSHKKKSK